MVRLPDRPAEAVRGRDARAQLSNMPRPAFDRTRARRRGFCAQPPTWNSAPPFQLVLIDGRPAGDGATKPGTRREPEPPLNNCGNRASGRLHVVASAAVFGLASNGLPKPGRARQKWSDRSLSCRLQLKGKVSCSDPRGKKGQQSCQVEKVPFSSQRGGAGAQHQLLHQPANWVFAGDIVP